MTSSFKSSFFLPLTLGILLLLVASVRLMRTDPADGAASLTVYSGRSEDLIQPLLDRFEEKTGITLQVRYGQTAEMAATILEEGANSPADIFFAQDAGALGALAQAGRFAPLPMPLLERVSPRFRSPSHHWVGVSGRARVLVYNPDRVDPEELPDDLTELCTPEWAGRVGWAPANGSFQAFVTAMRVTLGEEAARSWLACMRDNRTRSYAKNTPIVVAVDAGEIDIGLVNHYYLHAMQRERRTAMNIKNHYPSSSVLANVAGVGVIDTSTNQAQARAFIEFLLSETAQRYFTDETFEYPLVPDIPAHSALPALHTMDTPDMDLSELDDLQQTLERLQELGIL